MTITNTIGLNNSQLRQVECKRELSLEQSVVASTTAKVEGVAKRKMCTRMGLCVSRKCLGIQVALTVLTMGLWLPYAIFIIFYETIKNKKHMIKTQSREQLIVAKNDPANKNDVATQHLNNAPIEKKELTVEDNKKELEVRKEEPKQDQNQSSPQLEKKKQMEKKWLEMLQKNQHENEKAKPIQKINLIKKGNLKEPVKTTLKPVPVITKNKVALLKKKIVFNPATFNKVQFNKKISKK